MHPALVDIPRKRPAFFQEVGAGRGEALLVFEGEEFVGDNYGIWSSWLRDLPADADQDGDVDLGDLANLLGSYGYYDTTYDFDCDGIVDLSDLAELLSEYGRECSLSE